MEEDAVIAGVERVMWDEARRQVRYDNKTPGRWIAVALVPGQSSGEAVGAVTGTGATKREAAESMLADWRSGGGSQGAE